MVGARASGASLKATAELANVTIQWLMGGKKKHQQEVQFRSTEATAQKGQTTDFMSCEKKWAVKSRKTHLRIQHWQGHTVPVTMAI